MNGVSAGDRAAGARPWRVLGSAVAGARLREAPEVSRGETGPDPLTVPGTTIRVNSGGDDAWVAATGPSGFLFLALADGAGGAEHGGRGARLAVAAAAGRCLAEFSTAGRDSFGVPSVRRASDERGAGPPGEGTPSEDTPTGPSCERDGGGTYHGGPEGPDPTATTAAALSAGLAAARDALEQEASRLDVERGELATTLLLAVASPGAVDVLQVGDGCVLALDGEGTLVGHTVPERGLHEGETRFVTSEGALEGEPLHWHGDVRHLGALTDGIQRLALRFPEGTPHLPFFTPLFAFLDRGGDGEASRAELERFLSSPAIDARTRDDRTLVLASLPPREAST